MLYNCAMKLVFSYVVVAVLVLGSFYLFLQKPASTKYQNLSRISVGEAEFIVRTADSEARRQQGLSGTKSLGAREGMLFIFEEPATEGFWMKDMSYPIDIIWIDAFGRVVGVEREVLPDSYPDIFYPPSEILYALEVNAGVAERQNIGIGDVLEFKHK